MSDIDLDKLEQLAREAEAEHPEPWTDEANNLVDAEDECIAGFETYVSVYAMPLFLALQPLKVRAIIERLRNAEAERDQLQRDLEQLGRAATDIAESRFSALLEQAAADGHEGAFNADQLRRENKKLRKERDRLREQRDIAVEELRGFARTCFGPRFGNVSCRELYPEPERFGNEGDEDLWCFGCRARQALTRLKEPKA